MSLDGSVGEGTTVMRFSKTVGTYSCCQRTFILCENDWWEGDPVVVEERGRGVDRGSQARLVIAICCDGIGEGVPPKDAKD